MNLKFILPIFILIIISFTAYFFVSKNQGYYFQKIFYGCKKVSDCTLVNNAYCGNVVSVNSTLKWAWEVYDKRNAERSKSERQTRKVTNAEAMNVANYTSDCVNSICIVVPKNE